MSDVDTYVKMNEFAKDLYNRAREVIAQGEGFSPMLVMGGKDGGVFCVPVGWLMENNETKNILSWLPAYWSLITNDLECVALIVESWFSSTDILMEKTGCTKEEANNRLKELQSSKSISEYPPECRQEGIFMRIESATEQQSMMAIIESQQDGSRSLKEQKICEDGMISGRLTGLLSRAGELRESYEQFVENTAAHHLPEDLSKLKLFSMYISSEEQSATHANACRLAHDIYEQWQCARSGKTTLH